MISWFLFLSSFFLPDVGGKANGTTHWCEKIGRLPNQLINRLYSSLPENVRKIDLEEERGMTTENDDRRRRRDTKDLDPGANWLMQDVTHLYKRQLSCAAYHTVNA